MKLLYNKTIVRVILPLLCVIFILNMTPPVHAAEMDSQGAAMAIVEGYQQDLEEIDLSNYNLTKDELRLLFRELRNSGLLPWYADTYTYRYYTSSGLISKFYPVNLDPAEYDYALYEQAVQRILSECVFPDMKDWQIALSLHDYLVANCAYDLTYTYYEGYDTLVRRTSVCEGYSRAYMDLLNRVGVPCKYVISDGMNHAWNVVYVGGNWLHVDATWDDPTANREGRVRHQFFLKSDSMMQDADHEHYGWDSYEECPYTDWDTGWFWDDTSSAVCFESADVFYVRQRMKNGEKFTTGYAILRYSMSMGEWTTVHTFDSGYVDVSAPDGYNYFYETTGLTLYGGRLYFADMTAVYSCNPDGSDAKVHYSHDCKGTSSYISGTHVYDGVLYIHITDLNRETTLKTIVLDNVHTHNYQVTVVEPTCTAGGYTLYTCTGCGHNYTANQTNPTDHTYGDWIVTREPSCTEEGTAYRICSGCGKSQDGYADPLGHAYTSSTVSADCEHGGYILYVCSVCGHNYQDSHTDPLGHDYTVTVYPPDCTKDGYTEYVCSVCNHTYRDNPVLSSGHNYQAVVTYPTCQAGGYTTYTCPGCNDSYVADYTDPVDHNYGQWVIDKDPTCTEGGLAHRNCEYCGHQQDNPLVPNGHSYADTVKEPTCTEGGYTTHTCTVCNYSYTDSYTDPLSHNYTTQVKEPTCTAGGYTTHTCLRCGYTYTDNHTKALDHIYIHEVKQPTCTEGGYTTYGCIRCGHSYTGDFTDPRGHEYGDWNTVYNPSCTQPGLKYQDCLHCDVKNFDTIPVTAHSYENGVCTGCGQEEPAGKAGDVSGDGYVDSDDAYLILMFDAELIDDGAQIARMGDVSGDGYVDSDDAYLILMFDAELIDKFPTD